MGLGRRVARKTVRRVTPRPVRQARHPARAIQNAVTPRPVRQVTRAAYTVRNPGGATADKIITAALNAGTGSGRTRSRGLGFGLFWIPRAGVRRRRESAVLVEFTPAEGDETGEIEAEPGRARGQLPRGRKRREAIEAGARDTPYDTPLIGGILPKGAGAGAAGQGGAGGGARPIPGDDAMASEALAFSPAGSGQPGAGAPEVPWSDSVAGPEAGPEGARAKPGEPAEAGALAGPGGMKDGKPEQLMLTGASDASYTLPPAALRVCRTNGVSGMAG